MTITTNTLIINGTARNSSIFTNNMQGLNGSNITMCNDLTVAGAVHSERMDVSMTPYMKFKLQSNLNFSSNEMFAIDNVISMDSNLSDMTSIYYMNNVMNLNLAPGSIYNSNTGVITVPASGLYILELQASFSNTMENPKNGVYWYFENHPNPTARIAGNYTDKELAHSSTSVFLLKNDRIKPVFYSNDSNAFLVADNSETYVSWCVAATTTPMHSNYVRLP